MRSLVGALALHISVAASSFLPASDSGNLIINVRSPASAASNTRA